MSRILSRYVTRATLGLPREERLEMAAELRTHLIDRVKQLQEEGFGREEAEHLAVKAMGNVKVTNSQLLGHFFTTPLGWAVLAVVMLGGGSYLVWQRVPLPIIGQPTVRWEQKLSSDDLAFLMQREAAPRAEYKAATLSIPARTNWLYLTVIPRKGIGRGGLIARPMRSSAGEKVSANQTLRARLLLSGKLWQDQICPTLQGEKQLQVFVDLRAMNRAATDHMSALQTGGNNTCTGITFPEPSHFDSWGANWQPRTSPQQALPMNRWTVLAIYSVYLTKSETPNKTVIPNEWNPHDYLLAVMPADQAFHADRLSDPRALQGGLDVILGGTDWPFKNKNLPRPTIQ